MNRQEMGEEIAARVPTMAKEDRRKWRQAEELRVAFVKDYPLEKIKALTLDEYVIGLGPENRSFCYRLEREMDCLGRILGATAFKFGVYYGRVKSDPTPKYRFRQHWGESVDEAFAAVKDEIIALLEAAERGDTEALVVNRLSLMFKGKLLFVYCPDQYMPIYSERHLQQFAAILDIKAGATNSVALQRALMAYRSTWPELMKHSAVLFMMFLYETFPEVKAGIASESQPRMPVLDAALQGAAFIDKMPPIPERRTGDETGAKKPNYQGRQKRLKRIGDRGEVVVVEMEKKRLNEAGRKDLANKIQHISLTDDRAGYDVLSYDVDGTPRHIEVKATSAKNLERGFFLTGNELKKSKTLPNYYIYLVFAATSKKPRILPLRKPQLPSDAFGLEPTVYHITVRSD